MKDMFIKLLATAISLISIVGCSKSLSLDTPISAEINGIKYSSKGHGSGQFEDVSTLATYESGVNKYIFNIRRFLQSSNNEEVYICLILGTDNLIVNKTYQCDCYLDNYSRTTGTIRFSKINTNEQRLAGSFEFSGTDHITGVSYSVTNGLFDIIYRIPYDQM